MKRIRARLSVSEWESLRELCEERRESVTQVVRQALREFAAKPDKAS
ncbi:ribbon-helix-helix protein, CopG family [Streptomyces sp. NPDC001876]